MIDLHMHTTASDGRCTPEELVRRAREAGLRTISVTDHDTTAATAEVGAHAARAGLEAIAGIEITAVLGETDVHMLGYFIDPDSPALGDFLRAMRADRVERARAIAARLADLGAPIDIESVIASAAGGSGKAIARPRIADALVRAGHVATVSEAFERYIGEGKPAYVGRKGGTPPEVVELIARAGGVAAVAHPGVLKRDEIIRDLVKAGMPAIEAHHSKHAPADVARYLQIAEDHRLLVTGGSDFHGDAHHGALGSVSLPAADFERLRERAKRGRVAGAAE